MSDAAVPQGEAVHIDLDPESMLAAYVAHRQRLAEEVGALDATMLATQSRCSEWTVADVVRHLCDVDVWLGHIWSGEAPPFDQFDPLVTPHESVMAGRSVPDVDVRSGYITSTSTMVASIDPADHDRWGTTSISPLGFVPWWQSALHLLWDSWLHERDALLPIGIATPVEDDEVAPVLLYALALAGTFCRSPIDVEVCGARLVAGDGPPRVGPTAGGVRTDLAAVLIDALGGRGTLEDALADVDADPVLSRQLGGLARYFGS